MKQLELIHSCVGIETKMERAFKNGFLNLKSSNITEINPKIFEITILKTLVLS